MNRLQTSGLLVVLACLTGTGFSGLLPGGGGGNGYQYNRPGGSGIGIGIGIGPGVTNSFGNGIGRPSTSYGTPGFSNPGINGGNIGNNVGFNGQPSGSYGTPSAFGSGANQAGGFGGNAGYQGARGGGGGGGNGGYNYNNDGDGRPKPYSFQYEVQDAQSGNNYGQQESSDGNTVRGEYRVLLPDSRTQIVRYTADDATGYNADVQYEGQAQFPQNGGNAGGYQGGTNYQQGLEGFGAGGGGGGGGYHGDVGHGVGGNGNGFGTGGRPNNQYLPAGVDYGK